MPDAGSRHAGPVRYGALPGRLLTVRPALTEPDGLPVPRRYWAMLAIGLSVTLAVLDGAIANVALPTIAVDLHTTPSVSIWVVNAYQLAITVSLLPLASLGEIAGYQRVYRIGLLVFTLASLACALSTSLPILILARVVQGFGAAAIMSINGALTRFVYPQRLLGRGIGINAMVVAISSAIGPSVAAAILAVGPWPLLFAVNVPIGALALAIAIPSLPDAPRSPHRFDAGSAVLSALTFGLLIAAVGGLGHQVRLPLVIGFGMASLGCFILLGRRQAGRTAPLFPVDLLRIPVFGLSICTSIASFTAQMLAFVSLPFFLEQTLGRSAVETGLLLTPWPLAVAVAAPIAGRLSDRMSAGLLGGLGLLVLSAGLLTLVRLPAHPDDLALAWRLAVCGAGFGMFQTPNNRAMMQAAPRRRSGSAGGMLSTARLLGQTTGAALVAMIFALAPHSATSVSLSAAAGCALLAAVVSMMRPGRGRDPV